jgi:hypothetical protein
VSAKNPERTKEDAMRRSHRRLAVVLILAALPAAACTQQKTDVSSKKPSKIEKVQGTDVNRVTLSPKAAERIDLKTVPVRDEQLGPRKRLVGGEVVARPPAAPADGSKVWVRVSLTEGDMLTVSPGHPARILPLTREADKKATAGRAVKGTSNAKEPVLHYAVDSAGGLAPGQRVRVEVALNGAGTRKVVPHAAVVYDAKGKTWVYVNTDPLVFVRQPITIDYIQGDLAVLSDGPAAGTAVVTVGAAELLGTEFGK